MKRLRFATARQVFEAFPPACNDIESEPADSDPMAFIESLLGGPTPEDAVGFCAYMLPRREAVWWACQCIRATNQPIGSDDLKLLELAENWVKEPEEANRKAALAAGMAAAEKRPAAWAALGAGWSGGSMVDDPERPVVPPNYLTAQTVRAAVLTTLAQAATKERGKHLAASVQRAIKLVNLGSDQG